LNAHINGKGCIWLQWSETESSRRQCDFQIQSD
jgi:hypothetical protein